MSHLLVLVTGWGPKRPISSQHLKFCEAEACLMLPQAGGRGVPRLAASSGQLYPLNFHGKKPMVSCGFSPTPIQWYREKYVTQESSFNKIYEPNVKICQGSTIPYHPIILSEIYPCLIRSSTLPRGQGVCHPRIIRQEPNSMDRAGETAALKACQRGAPSKQRGVSFWSRHGWGSSIGKRWKRWKLDDSWEIWGFQVGNLWELEQLELEWLLEQNTSMRRRRGYGLIFGHIIDMFSGMLELWTKSRPALWGDSDGMLTTDPEE